MERLTAESVFTVRDLWLEQYRENGRMIAGTMARDERKSMQACARVCPVFLVPVPRTKGYMNLVWQVKDGVFFYKTLEDFQNGNEGPPDMELRIFDELLPSHGLSLLRGEIKSGLLTKAEAGKMIRYTREAYMDPVARAWLMKFNHKPAEFDYEQFMREFQPLQRWAAGAAAAKPRE